MAAPEFLGQILGDAGTHARSAFGVAQIPLGACVEIELVAGGRLMFLEASKLPARVLGGMAVLSVAAVAIAVIAQHYFDVRPCPWCVLQRGIFLVLAALSASVGCWRASARRGKQCWWAAR